MGISHPLSDEYDALRGAVRSPERTPPSSPPPPSSCCAPDDDYLEHQVSRMDTLAGIAIKYGVEISDIKRANGLVSDRQMFAHKTLLIPLPGKPIPSSVRLNGSGQRTKRAWAPSHEQNRDPPEACGQGISPAMSTLQKYYGLTSERGKGNCSTEMCVYRREGEGSFQSSSAAPDMHSSGCDNGFSEANGAAAAESNGGANKSKQDGSVRRRQKVEADDTHDDYFLADPMKAIKSLLPRPISSIRLNGLSRSVRKSSSTPNFVDDTESGSSIWTLNHESFTRPLLSKPAVLSRRTKTATD